MENKLTDLNNILFEQIERLNDDDLHGEALKQQIKRSQAIESVAGMIIANANTVLKAEKLNGISWMPMSKKVIRARSNSLVI